MGVRRVKGSRPPPHHHHNDKRHHATLPRDPIGGGGVDGIAVVVVVWRGWTDEGTQGFRVADGAPWFMKVDRMGRWKVAWRDGYGVGRWMAGELFWAPLKWIICPGLWMATQVDVRTRAFDRNLDRTTSLVVAQCDLP